MGKKKRRNLTSSPTFRRVRGELDADVTLDVDVQPHANSPTTVTVVLGIAVTNRSNLPLDLVDPYRLANRNPHAVSAWDIYGPLDYAISYQQLDPNDETRIGNERHVISFAGRPSVAPNDTYEWIITYKWPCEDRLSDAPLIFDYVIKPQYAFQRRLVRWHSFTCIFRFSEPQGFLRRLFKNYRIRFDSNRPMTYKRRAKRLWGWRTWHTCVFDFERFVVSRGTRRLRFVCFFEYPHRAVKMAAAAIGMVISIAFDKALSHVLR